MKGAISLGAIFVSLLVASEAIFFSPQLGENIFRNKRGITGHGYKSKYVRETIFSQFVDHSTSTGVFLQKLYINDQFYTLGGPVFIYVTAFGGAEEYWLEYSYISQIAEEQGGVIYALEPRFFGDSRPTPDLSLESLQLLTIEQNIGDLVNLASFLRLELAQFGSNRFILYGYDTGASIATFAHQQNPGLFDGVWAVAAPLDTFFNFDSYFYDIQRLGEQLLDETCGSILTNSYNELDDLILAGQAARITELFNLAQDINLSDEREINLLFYILSVSVANHFEWGYDGYRHELCQSIVHSVENGTSDLEALTAYLYSDVVEINVNWDATIEHIRQIDWDTEGSIFGERQTWYTTCTEWSWFRTSYALPEMARNRFTEYFLSNFCTDIFGFTIEQILAGNLQTKETFSLNPAIQNVFFTFGGSDPFRLLGVTSDLNIWSPGEVIPRFGKPFELLRSIPTDDVTPEFTQVRSNVRERILTWIGN